VEARGGKSFRIDAPCFALLEPSVRGVGRDGGMMMMMMTMMMMMMTMMMTMMDVESCPHSCPTDLLPQIVKAPLSARETSVA
jgi:hypothetical protein